MLLIPAVVMFLFDNSGEELGAITNIQYLGCFEYDIFHSVGFNSGPYATSSISECLQKCIGNLLISFSCFFHMEN